MRTPAAPAPPGSVDDLRHAIEVVRPDLTKTGLGDLGAATP